MSDSRREFIKKAFGGFVFIGVGTTGVVPAALVRSTLRDMAEESPFVLEAVSENGDPVFFQNPRIELEPERIIFSAFFEADRTVTIVESRLWFKGDVWMSKLCGPLTMVQGETLTLIQPVELHMDTPFGYDALSHARVSSRAVLAALGEKA